MTFNEKVYFVVRKIPIGKVATYGQIARLIGNPYSARAVGNALHKNPHFGVIPCHRVVNMRGNLSGAYALGGIKEQAKLLQSEGIIFSKKFQIDLKKYQWKQ